MSEPKVVVSSPPAPKVPTTKEALAHLDAVEKHAMSFVGKDGHNPFYWLAEKRVAELKRRLSGDPVSKNDIEAALSIPLVPPTI